MNENISLYLGDHGVVLFDTCSLATSGFLPAYVSLHSYLLTHRQHKLIVPQRILQVELPHLAGSDKPDAPFAAKAQLLLRQALDDNTALLLPDDSSYESADAILLAYIQGAITNSNIVLVTQDQKLTECACAMRFSCYREPHRLTVMRMTKAGKTALCADKPMGDAEEGPFYPVAEAFLDAPAPMPHGKPVMDPRSLPLTRGSGAPLLPDREDAEGSRSFTVLEHPELRAVFPATRLGLEKLPRLLRLGKALRGCFIRAEICPLLLPTELVFADGQAVGGLITLPAGFVPLNQMLKELYAAPTFQATARYIAQNLCYSAAFAHRCGFVLAGLDYRHIYVNREGRVLLGGCHAWQFGGSAAEPTYLPLSVPVPAEERLALTADSVLLVKLISRILNDGRSFDPAVCDKLDEATRQLFADVLGGLPVSARCLRAALKRDATLVMAATPLSRLGHCANPNCENHSRPDGLTEMAKDSRYCRKCFVLPAPGEQNTLFCRDCGMPFTLTFGQLEFYDRPDLCLPKRCRPCRNLRSARGRLPKPPARFTLLGAPAPAVA